MNKLFYILFFVLISCGTQTNESAGKYLLDANTFFETASDRPDLQLIDIRTPEEYQSGHLENALNINWYDSDFMQQMAQLDASKPLYIYCRSGKRSAAAADKLSREGFEVYDLGGGILSWQNNHLKMVNY